MAVVQMRNTQTGEFRPMVEGSAEFEAARTSRRHSDERPLWEQTSTADVIQTKERLEAGRGRDTDIPDGGQPVAEIKSSVDLAGIEFGPDRTEPTPGERAQNAGRAGGEQPEDISANSVGVEDLANIEEGETKEPDEHDVLNEGFKLGGGGSGGYSGRKKDDLQEEADARGIEVEGTGANGNVTRGDLVKALQDDDTKEAD